MHFEGAGQKTRVFIYLTEVGTHTGGYDEFTMDITEAVEAFKKTKDYSGRFKGNIPISIRVDNSRDLEMMPSDLSDFNLYGGLYRYVNLVYAPQVYVDKLFATPLVDKKGETGTVHVKARLNKEAVTIREMNVAVNLIDPSGKIVQTVDKTIKNYTDDINLAEMTIKKPQLWSPESPALYRVEVSGKAPDGTLFSHSESIGFRHFEFVEKGPFMLNGKRLLFRGTHRHEDHAGLGAAMTEDLMRKEMIMMKEMGVNFIRLGHYQQSRIILDLCDSLGILVWEEIPWCRGSLGGPQYQAMGKRMLTNMIEQHFNHPSVIIWGLGNEND